VAVDWTKISVAGSQRRVEPKVMLDYHLSWMMNHQEPKFAVEAKQVMQGERLTVL